MTTVFRRIGTNCITRFPRTIVNYSFSHITGDRLAIEGRVIRKMQEKGPVISCPSCSSPMNREYTAEINIHFPGPSGFDKPTIWVFPRLSVCLGCGCAQFTIPDGKLKQLQTR